MKTSASVMRAVPRELSCTTQPKRLTHHAECSRADYHVTLTRNLAKCCPQRVLDKMPETIVDTPSTQKEVQLHTVDSGNRRHESRGSTTVHYASNEV